jgi:hypothetical protein
MDSCECRFQPVRPRNHVFARAGRKRNDFGLRVHHQDVDPAGGLIKINMLGKIDLVDDHDLDRTSSPRLYSKAAPARSHGPEPALLRATGRALPQRRQAQDGTGGKAYGMTIAAFPPPPPPPCFRLLRYRYHQQGTERELPLPCCMLVWRLCIEQKPEALSS